MLSASSLTCILPLSRNTKLKYSDKNLSKINNVLTVLIANFISIWVKEQILRLISSIYFHPARNIIKCSWHDSVGPEGLLSSINFLAPWFKSINSSILLEHCGNSKEIFLAIGTYIQILENMSSKIFAGRVEQTNHTWSTMTEYATLPF